ncbi:MAG: cellulose binding domain-containing protein [Firmicutes bacterium]|nr:cellulose binding domain-containing protein [Bacillota bacterium]
MRKRLIIIGCLLVLFSLLFTLTLPVKISGAASQPYIWRNVEIVGGGFVPGIIFNTKQKDLVYARTDIGGAYRLDPSTRRWIPLTDFVSDAEYWLLGVESLATDPVDPNRVYIACGAYLQSWAGNGAIFRSTDKGNTWSRTDLPFQMGGNEPGRSIGERLMVDPNKNSIIYFGTRNNGLYKSADYGATWAQVSSFPVKGQSNLGIGWVVFDPSSGTAGNATQTIYAGVIDSVTPIYRSTNGGATWAALPGQPSAGIPHHGVLSSNGNLYITYGDQAGPYTMYGGYVYKYNTSTGVWTNISPLVPYQNGEQGFGFAGLAVDAQKPDTVMVATMSRWGPVDDIFRSTDAGATWKSLTANKVLDTSGSPYLNWGGTPKLGWMIGDLEIDPFNSGRILYGTGATIYGADDITNLDSGGTAHIVVRAQGLEETAVQDLISPPSGPPLISALYDIGGFRHDSLTAAPPDGMSSNPIYGSEGGLDFAELNPSFVVRTGSRTYNATDVRIAYSTDGGKTWAPFASEPPNLNDGMGTVAVSADGSTVIWSPSNAPVYYTRNRGASWTAVSGLQNGTRVVADRVNPNKFYAWNSGLSSSTDGGATFTVKSSNAPWGFVRAVPGREGDVWLAGDYGGLYHSTDSCVTYSAVGNFTSAETVGFGKAAPGQTYPAIYVVGVLDNVHGIYRSDDAGATWARINDDQHRWGWIGKTITGDPRVYGRVYVATNGRGIIYGEPAGTPTTPTPTTRINTPTPTRRVTPTPTRRVAAPTPTRRATPTPSRRVTPTPTVRTATPTPTARSGGYIVTYTISSDWGSGANVDIIIKNNTAAAVNGWTLNWAFPGNQTITNMWNATYTQSGASVSAKDAGYNATITSNGGTVSFGFGLNYSGTNAKPASFALNGTVCAVQ